MQYGDAAYPFDPLGIKMLERTPEPEVMGSSEEAAAYDEMDHQGVNDQFVEDLLSHAIAEGEILDIGTGTARIPIRLCEATDTCRVFATDLSREMLEVARTNIELASQTERIMLGLCDAKKLDLANDRFDLVISNSIVHHIPDPTSTFVEAVRVCKTGGTLFFRDLLRPGSEEEVERLVETYAQGESDHARSLFRDSLHAAFTVEEIMSMCSELGVVDQKVCATSDRHWTWHATKRE